MKKIKKTYFFKNSRILEEFLKRHPEIMGNSTNYKCPEMGLVNITEEPEHTYWVLTVFY